MVFSSVVTAAFISCTSVRLVEGYRPRSGLTSARRATDRDDVEPSRRRSELNEEERSLSARRARLHDRIDFLRSGGGGPVSEVATLVEQLEEEARLLSQRRSEVHQEIELLRADLHARS